MATMFLAYILLALRWLKVKKMLHGLVTQKNISCIIQKLVRSGLTVQDTAVTHYWVKNALLYVLHHLWVVNKAG
ncbi:hypothetical protein D3C75_995010 [compost metagenome]